MKRSPFKKKKANPMAKICQELWSKIVRTRDGYTCQKCDRTERSQAHHIFSVANGNTAYNTRNGITMCYHCHIWWAHTNTEDARSFIIDWLGKKVWRERYGDKPFSMQDIRAVGQEEYDLLHYLSNQPKKRDYNLSKIQLELELKEMQSRTTS